jgi:hypothetical protein
MKKLSFIGFFVLMILASSCHKKDTRTERFLLLTTPTWVSDSLLAGGVEAGGPGGFLEKFNGDAKFNEDGTGTFGDYTGQWSLNATETQVTIITTEIPLPIIADIRMLTVDSLKITTTVLNQATFQPVAIRMTFWSR